MAKYVSYPLENTVYTASDAQVYSSTRTSGVYSADDELRTVSNSNMTVTVLQGRAWIKPSLFSGFVFGSMEDVTLNISNSDSLHGRIDLVVVGYNSGENTTSIYIKKGNASTSPIAPSITRNDFVYELGIAMINIPAGTVAIQPGQIADLRLNESYCGLMRDGVTSIPTQGLYNEFMDWFNHLQNELNENQAVNLQNQIDDLEISLNDTNIKLNNTFKPYKVQKVNGDNGWYVSDTQTITLAMNMKDTQKGIVLVWSGYNPDTSTTQDFYYEYTFIPKEVLTSLGEGKNSIIGLVKDRGGAPITKTLYFRNANITGHADNASTTVNGGNNRWKVLRQIYFI